MKRRTATAAGVMTRRALIVEGSKLAAGTALGAGILGMLPACQSGNMASTEAPASITTPQASLPAAPEWPWPYVELDPKAVAQAGYEGFYKGACAYGTFNAIISALREKVGYPYTILPPEIIKFGEGGVVGWASLCGTIIGGSAAINLVAKDYSAVVNELVGWYTSTAFPSFVPANPKVTGEFKTSISGSPLCHVSVTEWCVASGKKAESAERADRCARLVGEVAAKAVELLNKQAAGQFKATFSPASSVTQCGSCHLKGGTLENARGKMDCVQCHEPHS